jgi:RsiW-degrading membrane proteinase PrsW (M82 family)
MDSTVFFVILLATILHAVWNAMVKHHPDKAIAVLAIVLGHIPLALICIFYFPFTRKRVATLYNCQCISSSRLSMVYVKFL